MSNRILRYLYIAFILVSCAHILETLYMDLWGDLLQTLLVILTIILIIITTFIYRTGRRELELRQQIDDQNTVLQNLAEAVIEISASDYTIQRWNPAAEKMYGWTAEEAIGKTLSEITPTEYVGNMTREAALKAVSEQGHMQNEVIQYHRSGRPVRVLSSVTQMRDSQGQVRTLLGINLDITQRRETESRLRTREEELNTLVNSIRIGFLSVDKDMRIDAARGDVLHDLAPLADNLIGQTVDHCFEDYLRIAMNARLVLGGKAIVDLIDVEDMSFDVHYTPITNQENGNPGVAITILDVTDRKRSDDALQRYAIRLEVLRQIDEAVIATLSSNEIAITTLSHLAFLMPFEVGCVAVEQNNTLRVIAFLDNRGRISMPLFGQLPYSYFHLENARQHQVYVKDLSQADTLNPLESMLNAIQVNNMVIQPLVFRESVIGVLMIGTNQSLAFDEYDTLRDVSRLLAVSINQAALYEQVQRQTLVLEGTVRDRLNLAFVANERADMILQSSLDPIILTDKNGAIRQTNPAFEDMVMKQESELLARSILTLFVEPDPVKSALNDVIRDRRSMRIEAQLHNNNGYGPIPVDIAIAPLMDINDEPDGLVLNVRDMTEVKHKTEELNRMLDRERELSYLRSRFVQTVSHEFRTPLTVILSSTDLMQHHVRQLENERLERHISRIQGAVQTMRNMLDDVIVVDRMNQTGTHLELKMLDLQAFVHQLLEEIAIATDHTNPILFRFEGDVVRASLDEKLFRQILTNLVNNAVKYSSPGTEIRVMLSSNKDGISLIIEDEGIGVPQKEQGHLFDAFFRASNVGTVNGTGLGLTITKQAVDLFGGTIKLQPRESKGTKFIVTLPNYSFEFSEGETDG